jgi:hypothetical protein
MSEEVVKRDYYSNKNVLITKLQNTKIGAPLIEFSTSSTPHSIFIKNLQNHLLFFNWAFNYYVIK